MPLYDYCCVDCGPFETRAAITKSAEPQACPVCVQPSRRVIAAPRLHILAPGQRRAHEINERSAQAPEVRQGHSCCTSGGCQHHASSASRTADAPPALKAQKGVRRPWMISH